MIAQTSPKKGRQQRYKERNGAKRYVFELHMTNDREVRLAHILDEAKKDKCLKALIVDALEQYAHNN